MLMLLLVFLGVSMADTWHANYENAMKAVRKKQWREAIPYLELAIAERAEPKLKKRTVGMRFIDYLPYFHLGLAYYKAGRWEKAKTAFEEALNYGVVRNKRGLHNFLRTMLEDCRSKLKSKALEKVPPPPVKATQPRPKQQDQISKQAPVQNKPDAKPQTKPEGKPETKTETPVTQPAEVETPAIDPGVSAIKKLMAEGVRLYQRGNIAEAAGKFQAVLQLQSSHTGAAGWVTHIQRHQIIKGLNTGIREYFSGNLTGSERNFRNAIRRLTGKPGDGSALVTALQFLAAVLIERHYLEGGASTKQLEEARRYIKKIIDMRPGYHLEEKYFSPKVRKEFEISNH